MNQRTAKEIGDALEAFVVDDLGAEYIPQSGAGKFYKLDNKLGGVFVFECKGTTKDSISIRRSWLQAIARVARSVIGGGANNARTALVLDINGSKGVLIDYDVFKELITRSEDVVVLTPDKATQRSRRASGSLL